MNRNHVEDVRERQPHRADLLPARHQAVEDAPRDDEVGAGVVVAERKAGARVVNSGRATHDSVARAISHGARAVEASDCIGQHRARASRL